MFADQWIKAPLIDKTMWKRKDICCLLPDRALKHTKFKKECLVYQIYRGIRQIPMSYPETFQVLRYVSYRDMPIVELIGDRHDSDLQ